MVVRNLSTTHPAVALFAITYGPAGPSTRQWCGRVQWARWPGVARVGGPPTASQRHTSAICDSRWSSGPGARTPNTIIPPWPLSSFSVILRVLTAAI